MPLFRVTLLLAVILTLTPPTSYADEDCEATKTRIVCLQEMVENLQQQMGTLKTAYDTQQKKFDWLVSELLARAVISRRYLDHGNGTVTDMRSRLIWLKNANCFNEPQSLEDAKQSATTLASGQCGLSDGSKAGFWRLPTKEEWEAMIDKDYQGPALSDSVGIGQWQEGDAFLGVQSNYYGSSTTDTTSDAWDVDLNKGTITTHNQSNTNYVWPVSSRRYTDNGDGTVTDNRSGLVWLKDAGCLGAKTWQAATDSVASLAADEKCGLKDGSRANDWRLPTKEEWEAMVDKKYQGPTLSNAMGTGQWAEGDAFSGVQTSYYWSSTEHADNRGNAWSVDLGYGYVGTDDETNANYVWPVRRRQ